MAQAPTPIQGEVLTVQEAAERLDVSPATVYKAIRAGRLPSVRLGKRTWRVVLTNRYLTVKEAAKALRVSPAFVYKAVREGRLPVLRLSKRTFRVNVDEFIANVLQEHEQKSA